MSPSTSAGTSMKPTCHVVALNSSSRQNSYCYRNASMRLTHLFITVFSVAESLLTNYVQLNRCFDSHSTTEPDHSDIE